MPVFYEQINDFAKIAIWHIAEEKNFFLEKVPLQREITHPHKQLQHLAGRYLLQYLFPDFPYHLIEIADTRKPYLPNEEYHFSISHCGDYAAVIVSKDHRVGIDIELVTPKIEKIKEKFLNENELSALVNGQWAMGNSQWAMGNMKEAIHFSQSTIQQFNNSTNQPPDTYRDNQSTNQLTLLWSCKESVFKWYGNGGVDFKEHIHLNIPGNENEIPVIECDFLKKGKIPLNIHYKYFEGMCMAWVATIK